MKKIIKDIFAKRLKRLMNENNETTYTIAELISMDNSTVSRYLNGAMGPKTPTVMLLAQHFEVNPVWLMGYDVDKKMPENESYSEKEKEIIKQYRKLNDTNKIKIEGMIELMISEQREKNKSDKKGA